MDTKQVSSDGAQWEYRGEGAGREESADEYAELSGADSKGLATKEEAETAVVEGGGSETRTLMAWRTHGSGAGKLPGVTPAGGSETRKATSAAANKKGSGGRHGARPGVRERAAIWQ